MLACRASMTTLGLNWRAVAAATVALGLEMSGLRNRNWRLRLERSIVSRSTCGGKKARSFNTGRQRGSKWAEVGGEMGTDDSDVLKSDEDEVFHCKDEDAMDRRE